MKLSKTFFGITALAGALALGLVFLTASTTAFVWECSACGGSVQSADGTGRGNSCSEALSKAYIDALNDAWSGAPACSPCQITTAVQGCGLPSCYPGPCPPNSYHGSVTLNHRCESCDPGDPPIP